ncbi:hypothetical protein ACEPAF_4280 [Sanghuangporus sanghuang]
MSSERDDNVSVSPQFHWSDSLEVVPPSLYPSSVVDMTSSVFGSSSLSSASSVLGSTSLHSFSDVLEPGQAQLIQFRVQRLEETTQAIMSELKEQGKVLQRLAKRGFDADDEDDETNLEQTNRSKKQRKSTKLTNRPLTALPRKSLTDEQVKTCNELLDPNLRKLMFPNVMFTSNDVDKLAKDAFRRWKKKHEKSQDPDKKKKHEAMSKKGVRKQRQRQKKIDRAKAAKAIRSVVGVNATSCCLTDWMSEYLSDRAEIVDKKKKTKYNNLKRRAAGYTSSAGDVPVWETVKPAFRSDEAEELYVKLDKVFVELQKLSRNKKQSVKHVFMGEIKYDIPAIAPYPFMVDQTWKKTFVDDKGLANQFRTLPEDPSGLDTKQNPVISFVMMDAKQVAVTAKALWEVQEGSDADSSGNESGEK